MVKRVCVGASRLAVVVALGVVVGSGCGGSSGKQSETNGSAGDATAGGGGPGSESGGVEASAGREDTGGGVSESGGADATGGSKPSGGIGQTGGSVSQSGGASPGGSGTATGGLAEAGGTALQGGEGGGGAASGGTTSAAGASPGTGGVTLPEPEVGTVGTECSEPGALQCAGTHQRVVVTCNGDGEWEAFETCPVGQYCDTRPGETLGSCQEPVAECVGKEPGETVCRNASVLVCGVDTLTTELVADCPEVCSGGQCSGFDPCPAGTDWINCSQDCTGKAYECVESMWHTPLYDGDLSNVYVIRTPAAADLLACDTGGPWAFFVRDSGSTRTEDLRFTVRAPWALYEGAWLLSCEERSGSSCRMLAAGADGPVAIMAEDENAPPTNVLVEHLPADSGEGCP
jgi:hypothetical protein